jgi:ABC-2 type transport system permease protein
MGGLIETLFLENCNQFADLVRSGDLDFYLLRPIDEQFLITCRTVDWSCLANFFMGVGVMGLALRNLSWAVTWWQVFGFVIFFSCGLALAYGFLLILTSASVWFMRNQSLFEVWWLFSTLMRYPREIFNTWWAGPVSLVFSFFIPIMLVTNIPARVMVEKIVEPWLMVFTVLVTLVVFLLSRRFFFHALTRYRSASS